MTRIQVVDDRIGQRVRVRSGDEILTATRLVGVEAAIYATRRPALAPVAVGDALSSRVIWGVYGAAVGLTLAPPVREMQVNGGAWVPYVGARVVAFGETYQLRETVALSGTPALARTYTTEVRATAPLRAPVVTVRLAETAYSDGQTVDISDIEPTIQDAGAPPLTLGGLSLTLRVNGAAVSVPHTAAEGQVLTGRATASHPTGAVDVTSAPVTVGPRVGPPPVQVVQDAGWAIEIVSDDEGGELVFTATLAGVSFGPFTRTAAQQISGAAISHVAPSVTETATAGTYAATVGLWTYGGETAPTAGYQWRRGGVAISGATGATYARTGADAGATLTCAVTVLGVTAVSNGVAVPGAGLTVTGSTSGITVAGNVASVTGSTSGITFTEA